MIRLQLHILLYSQTHFLIHGEPCFIHLLLIPSLVLLWFLIPLAAYLLKALLMISYDGDLISEEAVFFLFTRMAELDVYVSCRIATLFRASPNQKSVMTVLYEELFVDRRRLNV